MAEEGAVAPPTEEGSVRARVPCSWPPRVLPLPCACPQSAHPSPAPTQRRRLSSAGRAITPAAAAGRYNAPVRGRMHASVYTCVVHLCARSSVRARERMRMRTSERRPFCGWPPPGCRTQHGGRAGCAARRPRLLHLVPRDRHQRLLGQGKRWQKVPCRARVCTAHMRGLLTFQKVCPRCP
jgi:hypothetical protein